MLYGVDVSHYQGLIQWEKVKADGISFSINKIMYESTRKPDEYFAQNYSECTRLGINVGGYVYVASSSTKDPEGEAWAVLNILGKRKMPYFIWLDLEDKALRSVGRDRITEIVNVEASIYERSGLHVGIYANRDWYLNVLDRSLFNRFPFWCARYPRDDKGDVEERLSPRSYAQAWQYSSKGRVNGISGNVDRDIDFVGIANL